MNRKQQSKRQRKTEEMKMKKNHENGNENVGQGGKSD